MQTSQNLLTFDYFKNKKILVTGDTGFKGSWLCLWLSNLGADVTGYSLPPEPHQLLSPLMHKQGIVNHVDGDIRNIAALTKLIRKLQPNVIFHLAAQSLVRESYSQPVLTFETNVMGSINVLEAIKNLDSVETLIYVTSDKCYLNKELTRGYNEEDVLGGKDPYSASKACAEIAFFAYQESFFKFRKNIGIASTRAGNVIGGGDRSNDRIVPDTIQSLEKNLPILLRNPLATRPWQHVLDPLFGYMKLSANLSHNPNKFSGSWNFGPGDKAVRTVNDLAEILIREWGTGNIIHSDDKNGPHEATLLKLTSKKSEDYLGWLPIWNFERATVETVRWYKNVFNGADPIDFSMKQINLYMREVSQL